MSVRILLLLAATLAIQPAAAPWDPNGRGATFRNPVLFADYSDPDVTRVGSDFFMVSSSFSAVPGLPILHSRDLVNWTLVNHALPRLVPEEVFKTPQHGAGVWAPAIRHHAGKYWIYYPDPDRGLYLTIATDPRGRWSTPILVKGGKGLIDPCPFWDDDGSAYLVHAFARSRAGFANVLHLNRLSGDGTRVTDAGQIVINGDTIAGYTTLEGPKLYKRNGWYYVFAPAGGVKQGWQSVFRSRTIDGPYEARIVLARGSSDVNGPHQGALVDTPNGEWWFLHFQDADAYGRVVHLQPVAWRDDWPVIGADEDGDGTGEPRRTWKRPSLPPSRPAAPATSDDFRTGRIGVQWQWQANPDPSWISFPSSGGLRLQAVRATRLWNAPYLLLQKFPAPQFNVTASLDVSRLREGERAGLIVFGTDYAWIDVTNEAGGLRARQGMVPHAEVAKTEPIAESRPLSGTRVELRVEVAEPGACRFRVRDGRGRWVRMGLPFAARPGRWVGAKVGIFADGPDDPRARGSVLVHSVVITSAATARPPLGGKRP